MNSTRGKSTLIQIRQYKALLAEQVYADPNGLCIQQAAGLFFNLL